MSNKTRRLTVSAMLSALSATTLYIGSLSPTGQLGLAALASMFVAAAVIEAGLKSGIFVYIVASAASMLLVPNKSLPLFYLLFFGYYPILKELVEKIGNVFAQWALKLIIFNASLSVVYFFLGALISEVWESPPGAMAAYLAGNAVFALFDYGFSKAVRLYKERVSKKHKKDD